MDGAAQGVSAVPAGDPWGSPQRPERRSTHRVRGSRRWVRGLRATGAVLLAVVAGAAVQRSGVDPAGWFEPHAYIEVDGKAMAVPRPAPATGRLAPPVAAAVQGTYAFLHTTPAGDPVGYDPCRPVRYVFRPDGAPPGSEELVREAVAIVAQASGLVFEDDGTTDEAPAVARRLIQPERYGDDWAPVLIAWADESAVPELAGEVAGMGGSAAVPGADGHGQWLAAGRVVLDATDIGAMLDRPDGAAQARAIIVHELSHVLGLDHVDAVDELMHPISSTRTDLGPGDRAGLALVGQGPCQ